MDFREGIIVHLNEEIPSTLIPTIQAAKIAFNNAAYETGD